MKLSLGLFRDPGAQTGGATPLIQSERITIIDSLRGVALLGILLMNIPAFALSYQMYYNLDVRNEYNDANYYTWWIVNGGFEGTMRAIFTMLFGAGSLLLLERLEKKNSVISAADIYYRRLIWLLIFGIINAFVFLWPGDILYTYALCGLFLFPFRELSPKWLLALGILMMTIATFKDTLELHDAKKMRVKGEQVAAILKKDSTTKLTDEQKEDKTKWEAFVEKHKVENVRKEVEKEEKKMQKGYFDIMAYYKDINVKIQSQSFYNDYFWDAMCLLFIGMALFKWGVLTGERSKGFYWMMLLLGYAIGLPLSYYMLKVMGGSGFDPSKYFDKLYIQYYQEKRFFLAMGHIGFIMLLYKYGILKWLLNALAKVGQMAFTNYLSQSIICAIIFYGFGFGLYGKMQRYEIYYVAGAIWLFQIIFSSIWLKYFYFGPFEWVWRTLTYWKKQPMRRTTAKQAQPSFA